MFDLSKPFKIGNHEYTDAVSKTVREYFEVPRKQYQIRFGFERADGKVRVIEGGCHVMMNNLYMFAERHLGPVALTKYISCLIGSAKYREQYWSELFSDASPYHSLFDDLEIHRHSKEKYPIAFSVSINPDTSTQLLTNLAIAARMPVEYPYLVDCIYENFGDLQIADKLYLCATTRLEKGNVVLMGNNRGHFPLNIDCELSRLRSADPILNKDLTIGNLSTYSPNNSIWGGIQDYRKASRNSLRALIQKEQPSTKTDFFFKKFYEKVFVNQVKEPLADVRIEQIKEALANA